MIESGNKDIQDRLPLSRLLILLDRTFHVSLYILCSLITKLIVPPFLKIFFQPLSVIFFPLRA